MVFENFETFQEKKKKKKNNKKNSEIVSQEFQFRCSEFWTSQIATIGFVKYLYSHQTQFRKLKEKKIQTTKALSNWAKFFIKAN